MKFKLNVFVLVLSFALRVLFPGASFGGDIHLAKPAARPISSVRIDSHPIYRLSYPIQTMRMGYSKEAHLIFLTLMKSGQILVLDSRTGAVIKTISNVLKPLDATFDWKKRNILVTEGDSRVFHVIPLDDPSKMKDLPTGLNPTVVEYRGDFGTFLLAGAVHILYRLNSDSYQVERWTAFGDRIHEITFLGKDLYIPLLRHSRILILDGKTLQVTRDETLDLCERLTTVLPLSEGGLAALCENELLVRRKSGDPFHHRYSDDSPRTMVGPVLSNFLLIFYPDAQEMIVKDIRTLKSVQKVSMHGRPMWSRLNHDGTGVFVISSNPSSGVVSFERFALSPVYAPFAPDAKKTLSSPPKSFAPAKGPGLVPGRKAPLLPSIKTAPLSASPKKGDPGAVSHQ
ncbi:MAG: hypothetical protein M0Z37_06180 [Nitrospiraceae bacterium]|jgi:hypothetical protein|nr:hypothetical protein [Nitrospiraceae bacterium]